MESFDSIRDKHVKNLIEEMRKTAEDLIEAGMKPEDVQQLVSELLKEDDGEDDQE